jgi:hypothetical protein
VFLVLLLAVLMGWLLVAPGRTMTQSLILVVVPGLVCVLRLVRQILLWETLRKWQYLLRHLATSRAIRHLLLVVLRLYLRFLTSRASGLLVLYQQPGCLLRLAIRVFLVLPQTFR